MNLMINSMNTLKRNSEAKAKIPKNKFTNRHIMQITELTLSETI